MAVRVAGLRVLAGVVVGVQVLGPGHWEALEAVLGVICGHLEKYDTT